MGSNVNVKFIVIAGTVALLLGAGGLWFAYEVLTKTGEESVQLGDAAAAKDDWETAALMYSRAVSKDQSRADWIDKWIEAIRKTKPKTSQLYSERYFGEYIPALRARADADRTDVQPFRTYLQEVHDRITISGGELGAWELQLSHVAETMRLYRGDETAGKVLRRFSGLAQVRLLQLKPDLDAEGAAAARADLDAAIEADPTDEESVIARSTLDMLIAADHRKRSETEQMNALEAAAKQRLETFATTYPPAPGARLTLFQFDIDRFARTAEAGTTRAEVYRDRRAQIQQIVDAAFSAKKESLQPMTTAAIAELAEIGLESGANITDQLMTQALQGRPNDPQLLFVWGRLEMLRGNTEKAVQRLQTLVDLPDPPVSLDGIILQSFRSRGVSLQADSMFAAWEAAQTSEERESFEGRAKAYRTKLGEFVPADSPLLLSIDARIKFMEGDLNATRRLLADYNERTGARDPLTLQLLAEVLIQQGNTGAAKTNYERVLELDARNVRAMTRLAVMAMEERDFVRAKRYLEVATGLAPRDEAIKENLRIVTDLAAGDDAKDPVLKIINEIRPMTTGVAPDLVGATKAVREGLRAHPTDARLSTLLAELLLAQNDKEGAIAAIRAGLAANPDNGRLKQLDQALNDPDPVKSRLIAIDQSTLPEIAKHIERYRVLQGAGRTEEATAQLQAAAQLNPADPMVVELLFMRATAAGDMAELDRLCVLAEDKNLDQSRGLVYRARRDLVALSKEPKQELRRSGMESVAAGLRTALSQDKLNPSLWRMLGIVQLDLGLFRAAADSFTEAVRIRPNDAMSNTSLVKALMSLREYDDALVAARRAEVVCGRDPEFARLLLILESEGPGGDREKALTARKRIAESNPDDLDNKLALVSLLLMGNRLEEAEPLAEEIAKKDARLGAAARSAVLARRGNRDEAVAVYRAYLDTVTDTEQRSREYVAASTFFAQVAGREQALALLMPAREFQNPATREIDRTIGDLHFDSGDHAKAIEFYESVLSSGAADEGHGVLKRIIESYLRQSKFQQAEELIATAGAAAKTDPILLILTAQAAAGLGNMAQARLALDQAVAAAPSNYLVYYKRAEFTSADSAMNRDTESDLEQALKLNPELTPARRMLATMYFSTARTEQGIDQIRKAVAATPADVQLRMDFVRLLLALDRTSEALDVVEDAVKRYPDDFEWKFRAAQVFTETGRTARASQLVGDIFAKYPNSEIAELYIASLTAGQNPNVTKAMEVLSTAGLGTDQNWRLIMLRARVWAKANKPNEAMGDILLAWGKVDQKSRAEVQGFFRYFSGVFAEAKDQIAALGQMERRAQFTGWSLYQASMIRLAVAGLESQALSALAQIADTGGQEPALTAAAWSAIGANAYRQKDYENALKAFQRALAATPDDPELNNNVAYTLGVDLKRPNDALPFALAAARAAPGSPMILDTLGALYHSLGQNEEARPVLERAVNLATTPVERVPALLHLSKTLFALEDRARARHFASLAEQFIKANPYLTDHYGEELKKLLQTLDGQ